MKLLKFNPLHIPDGGEKVCPRQQGTKNTKGGFKKFLFPDPGLFFGR